MLSFSPSLVVVVVAIPPLFDGGRHVGPRGRLPFVVFDAQRPSIVVGMVPVAAHGIAGEAQKVEVVVDVRPPDVESPLLGVAREGFVRELWIFPLVVGIGALLFVCEMDRGRRLRLCHVLQSGSGSQS